jgi:hypothetical protein
MKHYICMGGCEGESSNPGVCESEGCKKEGEPLNECNCVDGAHADATKEEEGEEME